MERVNLVVFILLAFMTWLVSGYGQSENCPRYPQRVQGGRTCQKGCQNDSDCHGQLKKCLCDGACGRSCINPVRRCLPVAPVNGEVVDRRPSYVYGNIIQYRCNVGYKLEGNGNGRCNENGTWGALPNCVEDLSCDFESYRHPLCAYFNNGTSSIYAVWRRLTIGHDPFGSRGNIAVMSSTSRGILRSPNFSTRERARCLQFYYYIESYNEQRSLLAIQISDTPLTKVAYPREQRFTWLSFQKTIPQSSEDVYISIVAKGIRVYIDKLDIKEEPCDNTCQEMPCRNNGTCIGRIGSIRCICQAGNAQEPCDEMITCAYPELQDGLVAVPAQESDGRISVDQRLTFRCLSPRQELIGRTELTCLNSGRLSGDIPACQMKRCPVPIAPVNGEVNDRGLPYVYDEYIYYSCKTNYKLKGKAYGRCNENSTWEPVPTCKVDLSCGFESYHNPLCSYFNNGSSKWGIWRRVQVTRTEEGVGGGVALLSTFATGILRSPTFSTRENARCLQFHYYIEAFTEGTSSITVQISGSSPDKVAYSRQERFTWLSYQKTIPQLDEDTFVLITGGGIRIFIDLLDITEEPCDNTCHEMPCRNNATCVARIDSIRCICQVGSKQKPCNEKITCAYPELRDGLVAEPAQASDGRISVDQRLTFRCSSPRQELIGRTELFCVNSGRLNGDLPVCQIRRCPVPVAPVNGEVDDQSLSRTYGEKIRYSCIHGYKLEGNDIGRCNENTNWGPVPTCSRITCAYPELQDDLVAEPAQTPDSRISIDQNLTFSCLSPRQVLIGNTELTCLKSGRLNDDLPVCQIETDCNFETTVYPLCKYTSTGRISSWYRKNKHSSSQSADMNYAKAVVSHYSNPAIMQSPPFSPRSGVHCLQFEYYLVHSHMTRVDLLVKVGQIRYTLPNHRTNMWLKATVNIDESDEKIRVKFVLRLGKAYLDNIKVLTTACENSSFIQVGVLEREKNAA